MYRTWAVLTLFLFTSCSWLFKPQEQGFEAGVYSLRPTESVLQKDFVEGALIAVRWFELEPVEGQYDWSMIDEALELVEGAGKVAVLNVMTSGVSVPSWLLDNYDVQVFDFVDENQYHPTYGDTFTVPVYWDSVYLAKKFEFLSQLAERYAGRESIVAVMVSFVGTMTNDWFIPDNAYGQLLDMGYSNELMLEVARRTVDFWAQHFPDKALKMPIGFSPAYDNVTSTDLAEAVIDYAYNAYPGRFYAQINALSTIIPLATDVRVTSASPGTAYYLLKLLAEHPGENGLQMLCDFTSQAQRLDNGNVCPDLSAGCVMSALKRIADSYQVHYVEFWYQDLENNGLDEYISAFTEVLK